MRRFCRPAATKKGFFKKFSQFHAGRLGGSGRGRCERQPAGQAPAAGPAVTFKPQEMADALHGRD